MADALSSPGNISTNVRSSWSRPVVSFLCRLAPDLAAFAAERFFFSPPPTRASRGDAMLRSGHPLGVSVDGRRLAAWRWGQGPAVVLLHGWGGRAAQLTAFVAPLVERGFTVVAFDAPGHGRSGRSLSSAPQFARALLAVARSLGGLHGVVAHSLGAAATALALRDGLSVARLVFVGPAADPPSWVAPFAARFGITPAVVERLQQRSERRLGLPWSSLRVPALAPSLDAPLLVIHDEDDAEVPVQDGLEIAAAWPNARFEVTEGLGHNRPLRDPSVVARAVEFLADGARVTCACGAALGAGPTCETCQMEYQLYHRDARPVGPALGPAALESATSRGSVPCSARPATS